MKRQNAFFEALGVDATNSKEVTRLAVISGISVKKLRYYNEHHLMPSGTELEKIIETTNVTKLKLMLKLGCVDHNVAGMLSEHADEIITLFEKEKKQTKAKKRLQPVFETNLGKLYHGNCIEVLMQMPSNSVDMVFADPPFNLNKLYPSNINDDLKAEQYLDWCEDWIDECVRVLKFGGAFLLWNLPKWNSALSNFLNDRLTFRHWIATDIKYRLPIKGRLYPAHYSLLYYINGDKPKTFHPDRLPMQVCPKCSGDLKDYGGYKAKMNPAGVNMSDIWIDIPPVRHNKYKRREGANELSLKLLDRIVEMSTDEGDIVFDPFGGSGTTYMASELKKRKWIGCEIGPVDDIVNRFDHINEEREILNNYRDNLNSLFPKQILKKREKEGLWTCESVRSKAALKMSTTTYTENSIPQLAKTK
ncbi:DNA modification methylase (plasmid) [Desulfocapsa sulfexigens DSM 10523]|uniref:site-specific DNA-methyltransferase (adenine-specific) n=1 Tax=Desulfocapsa sulfexigens (strain DSM 10523 / SB164P1) TaxID=1167006 RepID=M1NKK0_DESSD|nr:site-specific DNA-methyltransferase [Desulfocapsa sulfexigens]AGF80114.1 DNA modification methylase [Desulfocapsa sulfexigens DSM 10523]